jgi:cysteinyl-tRNA synthetase
MEALDKLPSLKTSKDGTWDVNEWRSKCYEAMNDDFNTPILIAHIFDAVTEINRIDAGQSTISEESLKVMIETLDAFVYEVLGLQKIEKSGRESEVIDSLVNIFIEERKAARAEKNWALSDSIRDRLAAIGITLKDGKEGTTYTIEEK